MAARPPRSSAGCWTCRLRRKKCDEARPVCEGCAALEIECLYSESRPSWMDNGPRQRAMADRLKLAVKDRAAWRREKRFLRDIEAGAAAIRLGDGVDGTGDGAGIGGFSGMSANVNGSNGGATHIFSVDSLSLNTPIDRPASPPSTASPSDSSGTEHGPTKSTANSTTNSTSRSSPVRNGHGTSTGPSADKTTPSVAWSPEASLEPPSLEKERELNLMMMYLDYVFPFLYPFCRPTVLGSGRGWLLVLLMKNKAVFHSALSLSSYFLAVVATTAHALENTPITTSKTVVDVIDRVDSDGAPKQGSHGTCLMAMASELHKQQELSLKELQRTITAISGAPPAVGQSGDESHLAQSARALESILQLLSFEGLLQRFDRWHVHLDAALALFEQIMEQYGKSAPPPPAANGANGDNGVDGINSYSHCGTWAANNLQPPSPSSTPSYGWPSIMAQLSPFHTNIAIQNPAFPVPYSSDQAALKFYASLLLYMDIVTSTVTETAPRLQQYHTALLGSSEGDCDEPGSRPSFVLFDPSRSTLLAAHEVVGIRNWVLLALADTAALAAWKKEAASARRLTVAELLARAAPIERRLRTNLDLLQQKLSTKAAAPVYPGQPAMPSGFYSRYIAAAAAQLDEALAERQAECRDQQNDPHNHHHGHREGDPSLPTTPHADLAAQLSVDTVSHIWGLAVLTYLRVVVNGWQPAADDVRQSADALLRELANLPSASCLRIAAWPLCVAGCLAASPQQRAIYPGMVGEICGGELFGTVNEALRIMRAVWAAQDLQALGAGNGEVSVEWDFARCFNILGRRAFLL